MFISWIVLFGTVISCESVSSELETTKFNTPADIPTNSSAPSSFAQFFGRKVPREKPRLSLTNFLDQYPEITVYGAMECGSIESPTLNLGCYTEKNPDALFDTDCASKETDPQERALFQFEKKAVLKLKNALGDGQTSVSFPQDSLLTCTLAYFGKASDGQKDHGPADTLVVEVSSRYQWEYSTTAKAIQKVIDRDSQDKHEHVMQIKKGFEAKMKLRVNEMTESFVDSNGNKESPF